MTLCFVLTENLNPVPEGINVLERYGYETVFSDEGKILAQGEVILISFEPDDIKKWLGGKKIWVGNGLSGYHEETVKI